jgi:LacI family transcriptional regulator
LIKTCVILTFNQDQAFDQELMNPTMKDIAKRAGTTPGVVSVTLNGAKSKTLRVSQETRQRVLFAAEELGYKRDPRASALASGRNRVIGMMLPYLNSFTVPDPFSSLVTAGVAAGASLAGYDLMLYTAVAEEEGRRAAHRIDKRIDGLVLVLPPDGTPILAECKRLGIAVVAVLVPPHSLPMTVNSSDYEGGRVATEHLLSLGHRRIGHILGHPDIHTSEIRNRAYREALIEAGVKVDPQWVADGFFARDGGYEAMQQLLKLPSECRPTAVFAANDLSAHGAIDAIREAGLRVPQDISVVGYDNTWYASVINPPLTTVQIDVDRIGRCAVEKLIGFLEGGTPEPHTVVPTVFVIRESTGPAPT